MPKPTDQQAPYDAPPESHRGAAYIAWMIGIPIAVIMIAGGIYAAFFWLPAQLSRGEAMQNMQKISRACVIYGFINDDHAPLADSWMDALTPFTPLDSSSFHSPLLAHTTGSSSQYGIAMNKEMSGSVLGDDSQSVLFYGSSSLDRNASGSFPADAAARYEINGIKVVSIAGVGLHYGYYDPQKKTITWLKPGAASGTTDTSN